MQTCNACARTRAEIQLVILLSVKSRSAEIRLASMSCRTRRRARKASFIAFGLVALAAISRAAQAEQVFEVSTVVSHSQRFEVVDISSRRHLKMTQGII